jgi:hypothetical protein
MSSETGYVSIAKNIRDRCEELKETHIISITDFEFIMIVKEDYINAKFELYNTISKHPNVNRNELIKAVINFKTFLENQKYSLLLGNYTSLINIFCNLDCEDLFKNILSELNFKKLQIKNKVYSPILYFYCRNNKYIDALASFRKMEELDIVVENDYINILTLFKTHTEIYNNFVNKYMNRFGVPQHEGIIEILRATRSNIVNSHKCSHCNCKLQTLDNVLVRRQLLDSIDKHVINTNCGRDKNRLSKTTIENGQNVWRQFTQTIKRTKFNYVIDFFNVNCKFIPQHVENKGVNIYEFRKLLNNNRLKGKKILCPISERHFQNSQFYKFEQMCKREFTNVIIFKVPYGYNDDWYWLYASLYHNSFLLTEDNCDDHRAIHTNSIEEKNFFDMWKNDHVVKFINNINSYSLEFPKPYSERLQIDSLCSKIHFPLGGEWFCANL